MLKRSLSLILLLVPAVVCAEDLPPWNDDSGMVVTPYPSRFAAAVESTNLVTRVFHDVDTRVEIAWTIVITDADGAEVRHFREQQEYAAGEAMQFAPTWNGLDDLGGFLPDGPYTVTATAEMRAAGPRGQSIRQRSAGAVIIDSLHRGRAIEAQWQAPHEPAFPFNFYYGTLHNHSRYSDGGHPNDSRCTSSTTHAAGDFDPAQAYSYARNIARLDFLGITDHNHFFENACPGCSAAQVIERYHDGLAAAANATTDGFFVGLYGMEWGYISTPSLPNQGHVGLFEVPKLFGWESSFYEVFTDPAGSSYPAMYTKALENPSPWGAFGQFMHPSDGTKSAQGNGIDFNNIQYTTDGDDLMHTAAVISGPATDPSTAAADTGALYAGEPVNGAQYSAYASTDMYNRILSAGFHVAPVADPDVHCSNYGTSTRDRTVILAPSLTKAAIMDAIHHRRVYATSNSNTQLAYTMIANGTTYYMGDGGIRAHGAVPTSGPVTLHVSVWDPDVGQSATSIKIKEPVSGAANVIAGATSSPFDYTFTPPVGPHTYYVYVTMNTGDRIFSAPIWIDQGANNPPPTQSIDVSGWKLVQANASYAYVFPAGTTIQPKGYLIIARNSSKASFEKFWKVTLAANVGFINAGGAFPVINGSENYTLYDAAGALVDGTTISMSPSGLQSIKRKDPCLTPNLAWSWNVGATTNATPGSGAGTGCGHGVVINEFSDASGTGNFVYEFVELHFDD